MRDEIQKEAVEIALANKSGTLDLAVRTGKTLVGCRIVDSFNNCLISIPNLSIKESWIGDSEKFDINLNHCTFTTHVSLSKHDLSEFDCVILDEIDQISENQWEYIKSNLPKRLYGLTGTPPVNGVKKEYLDEYCPIIYSKKLDETVGVLQKDYEIIVHQLPVSKEKNIKLKSGKFWSEEAKINFWENKYKSSRDFMDLLKIIQAIQNSPTKLNYLLNLVPKTKRCLIFLETIDQCKNLPYFSYNSKEKNSENNLEMFQKNIVSYLTCVKQLSAGITFPDLNEIILLHAYASNNKAHQRIARCLNYAEGEKAKIHILCLKGTRDEKWVKQGLAEFNQDKIKWI